jgi:hypothetical protein
MDTLPSSYSLDANLNTDDLWASVNGSYISNNSSIQPPAPPNLAFVRRYAASKPPYSCK